MAGAGKRATGTHRAAAPPGAGAATAVPLSHPAMALAMLAATATILLCVTYLLFEPDFWQHLTVGRAIWETRSVPATQVWTWPTYGMPEVTPSWLFRALIWPVWSAAGVWGLFAWRWLTTLLVFGVLWAVARRMGARGFAALGVLLLCALAYRTRSQIRPETLVAVLMASQLWLLETRRQGSSGREPWLVAVAWIWANAHISYYLGFLVLGAYLADDAWRAVRGGAAERARCLRLVWTMLAAAAISFVNPFGWAALWQPVDYFLHLRHETIFRSIDELQPFSWRDNVGNGLVLLVIGWPLLVAWRVMRRTADTAEILLCVTFTALALPAQRFFGTYALVAAPFVMRDLDGWLASRRWPSPPGAPWWRAAGVLAVCVAILAGELRREDPRATVGIDAGYFPVGACDFIAAHGIRARMFNQFYEGGYLLYRFWPERERLPFMDIHQSGGPEIRDLYMRAFRDRDGWQALDERFRFDVVLMDRRRAPKNPLLDVLDADSAWVTVFADDAASLHLRRSAFASLADSFGYRHLPTGAAGLLALGLSVSRDARIRGEVEAELKRQVESSPWHAGALSLLANLALSDGRYDEARALLERGLALSPGLGRAHERLGLLALEQGQPREALRAFERERALAPTRAGTALLIGTAWQRLGEPARAREWYRRELDVDPGSAAARDSLAALDRAAGAGGAR